MPDKQSRPGEYNRMILASKSPRRQALLKQMGFAFDVIPSTIEQEDPIRGKHPEEHVIRLSETKALDVGRRYPDRWVLAADTIVCIDGIILGKPRDGDQAMDMLRCLSGKEHRVLTGFSIHRMGQGKGARQAVQTTVRMKPLTESEMAWYVQTGEPFDKAGGYAIQGIGSFMIESIHGSYTNVVGLPLCEAIEMLKRLGAITISKCGIQIIK